MELIVLLCVQVEHPSPVTPSINGDQLQGLISLGIKSGLPCTTIVEQEKFAHDALC